MALMGPLELNPFDHGARKATGLRAYQHGEQIVSANLTLEKTAGRST